MIRPEDYKQIFLQPIRLCRAPWWAIWIFNLQRAIGWIAFRRLALKHPHPWDEKG